MTTRTDEIEVLVATLGEPARALLRAAIVAQRQGRLDAAARVAQDQLKKRKGLEWPVLLLALQSAELRLGGSVVFTSPTARYEVGSKYPLGFAERWGPFFCVIYPGSEALDFELIPNTHMTSLRLRVSIPKVSGEEKRRELTAVESKVVDVLRGELEAFLGI